MRATDVDDPQGRGSANIEGPPVVCGPAAPTASSAAVLGPLRFDAVRLTVFAVNRSPEALALEVAVRDLDGLELTEHLVLCDDDLAACNTPWQPDRVRPRAISGARLEGGRLRAELSPRSWNVLRLAGVPGGSSGDR
jgi:alpha-L-arabinofuranosidase